VPLQQLETDLTDNTVARFNWTTPDQYNDMHLALKTDFTYNGVTYTAGTDGEQIALGDNVGPILVPEIEASQPFNNNREIAIWNDESRATRTWDRRPTLTALRFSSRRSPKATPTDNILCTHSSDLVTLQNIFEADGPKAPMDILGRREAREASPHHRPDRRLGRAEGITRALNRSASEFAPTADYPIAWRKRGQFAAHGRRAEFLPAGRG
jgi:hypothetical protein